MNSIHAVWVAALLAVAPTTGCGPAQPLGDDATSPSGSAQDIEYARGVIESGGVPKPEDFEIRGLLNEHDTPLEDEPCDDPLCLNTGFGVETVVTDGRPYGFLQIDFEPGADEAAVARQDLNLAVVIDTSAPMSDAIPAIQEALHRLLTQLTARDRLCIVTYDSRARVLIEPTLVSSGQYGAFESAIDDIMAGGRDADLEEGVATGYGRLAGHAGEPGVSDRLMLFTHAPPDSDYAGADEFFPMVEAYASKDIGFTLLGVGFDVDGELADRFSRIRGANYYTLGSNDEVEGVFDRDFDYMVTPIAYDVYLHIALTDQMSVTDVFNLPSADGNGYVEVQIATLFFRRDAGASLVRIWLGDLQGLAPGALIGTAYFRYQPPDEKDMKEMSGLEIRASDAAGGYQGGGFSDTGTRKAAALVNEGLAMKEACRIFWEEPDRTSGVPVLEAASDLIASEGGALEDEGLLREVDLLEQLVENIETAD